MPVKSFFMLLLAFTPLLLSACGLTPVYGTKSYNQGVSADLSSVKIAVIPEKSGLDLRNELIDRMYRDGRPVNPAYELDIAAIREVEAGLGIAKDASVTRSQLRQGTTMRLIDNQTGETVLQRDISAVTSFNVLDSHFTTLISEREARHNGIIELAEQIMLQLELFFASENRQESARQDINNED